VNWNAVTVLAAIVGFVIIMVVGMLTGELR